MRKKVLSVLIPLILVLSLPTVPHIYAAGDTAEPVSPALNILAENVSLAVNGECGVPVRLTAEKFEDGLGIKRLQSVTVLSLPPITEGRLMLGQTDVVKNQVISRAALSELSFVPTAAGPVSSSFTFRAGNAMAYELSFSVFCTDGENASPVPSSTEKIKTFADIACFGCLNASDPDGDPVAFRISSYPENGLLVLNDPESGDYSYTPVSGFTGKDSFRYIVTDRYGNKSEAKISVEVEKNKNEICFTDMIGEYGHSEAIIAVDAGIMEYRSEMGKRYFSPDDAITRLDFLVSAMKSCGYRIATTVSNTGFNDDAAIDPKRKGFVSAAVKMGFLDDADENGNRDFRPGDPITYAEASVILNRMLSLPVPVSFTPDPLVPEWASEAYACMSANGLLPVFGTFGASPERTLDRADAAVLLNRVCEYRRENP